MQAIFEEDDLPPDKEDWVEINEERSQELPAITEKTDPLPGAEEKKESLGF